MSQPLSQQIENFQQIYDCWKIAIAHIQVTSVSIMDNEEWTVLAARIEFIPQTVQVNTPNEVITTSSLRVGRERIVADRVQLDEFLAKARSGQITNLGDELKLPRGKGISEYSPTPFSEPDYVIPQLEVKCDGFMIATQSFNYERANSELRAGLVPFDGLVDLLSYFGFGANGYLPHESKIVISLHPPCDAMIGQCSLSQNKLTVSLLRKSEFDPALVKLGIRLFPDPTFSRRFQAGQEIKWESGNDGFDKGIVTINLPECTTAEVMLTAGGHSVRRRFLEDPNKSLNLRLSDYRVFDPELAHLKKSLRASKGDARMLEVGVATLLYLLGAATLNPPTTETPDVIVETPGRRVALFECTTGINDLRSKIGKLVTRRATLQDHHARIGAYRDVMAVLVVNLKPAAIASEFSYLVEQQVVLLTLDDIDLALEQIHVPQNLDTLYIAKVEEMRAQLAASQQQSVMNFSPG